MTRTAPHLEPPRYLEGRRLLELLPPMEALRAIQRFFAGHGPESVVAPERIHLRVPGRETVGLYMPSATREYVGVKIVHLMPSRYPSVEAEIFLYDAETGRLLFWGDGKPLTGLRTAAVSCAASLRLKPDCRRLLVYGAGIQAAAHIVAFAAAYPMLEDIRAAARSAESFRRLQGLLPAELAGRVTPSAEPAADLAAADCAIATTPAPEPLFRWEEVPAGCHLVGIGSATPEMNELPPAAFREAEAWVDTRDTLRESGDLHAAQRSGWSEAELAGDLFALLAEPPPRPGPKRARATLFKSAGHAAQDLPLLIRLWEAMQEG